MISKMTKTAVFKTRVNTNNLDGVQGNTYQKYLISFPRKRLSLITEMIFLGKGSGTIIFLKKS